MSTKLSLSFAALVALGALSGCRQVTIVSFVPERTDTPREVNQLWVDASPQKRAIFLRSLDETVGFYDLQPMTIIAA
jgi:hypothetical protein